MTTSSYAAPTGAPPTSTLAAETPTTTDYTPLPPPQRSPAAYSDDPFAHPADAAANSSLPEYEDSPSNPASYIRDPHKLVAYLVPFPAPAPTHSSSSKGEPAPLRFLIYTPPPPPLIKPAEGEKEDVVHKVQRKWQEEVRQAKQVNSKLKVTSWKGLKGRVTKGIDWGLGHVTTADLDFLNRVPGSSSKSRDASPPAAGEEKHTDDGVHEDATGSRTVGLSEMVLVYSPALGMSEQHIREEFVASLLRTKTKAQKDAVIATGLLPVAYGIDILATLIWPFGGLGEADTVWAYASIKGAKTARSVTKRLASSTQSGNLDGDGDGGEKLKLKFVPSSRVDTLGEYLRAKCIEKEKDKGMFDRHASGTAIARTPTETEVLEAIGWQPSRQAASGTSTPVTAAAGAEKVQPGQMEDRNWEDEAWEAEQVREDLKQTMSKAGKAWGKWVKAWEKDPTKAVKKN